MQQLFFVFHEAGCSAQALGFFSSIDGKFGLFR
jgi:hypothetical protein